MRVRPYLFRRAKSDDATRQKRMLSNATIRQSKRPKLSGCGPLGDLTNNSKRKKQKNVCVFVELVPDCSRCIALFRFFFDTCQPIRLIFFITQTQTISNHPVALPISTSPDAATISIFNDTVDTKEFTIPSGDKDTPISSDTQQQLPIKDETNQDTKIDKTKSEGAKNEICSVSEDFKIFIDRDPRFTNGYSHDIYEFYFQREVSNFNQQIS